MTALETLAEHIATARLGTATDLVALHVIDTLAAWAAGTRTREGRALVALYGATAEDVGTGIALHTALARLSEIDDIHLASMTTPGSIVVPAAIVIASSLPDQDMGRLADAISGGYEAMTRLGLAIDGPSVLYRGIWPTYFAAPLGVAAVASRLLGHDATRTAHALALAMITAAPGVGHHNAATTTRWLAVGNAARHGWTAALAAQAGFTSDLAILDGPMLKNVLQITADAAALTRDLGSAAMLERISFKPWCGARQTMAAVQAVKEIAAQGVAASDVTAITVHVLPAHLKMIDHGVTAGDRASHLTSAPYQIALALLAPEAMAEIAQSPASLPPGVAELMARIRIVADDGLLAGYPAAWSARVVVETRAGRRENVVSAVPGDPARPWSMAEVRARIARYVTPIIGAEAAAELVASASAALDGSGTAATVMDEMRRIAANA